MHQGGVHSFFSTLTVRLSLISMESMDPRSLSIQWAHLGSNQGPTGYEPVALPAELWAPIFIIFHPLGNVKLGVSFRIPCLPAPVPTEGGAGRSNRHSAFEYQLSTNAFNFLARLGCLNFRNAFASICRILSRVTSKSCPTSSRV